MHVTGIIFANDGTVSALTEKRTMASLPFGGRYRQVDFALSNLAYAGVQQVGILVHQNYQSLMHHVGSGEEWGLAMGEGGLTYLTPLAAPPTGMLDFLEYGAGTDTVVLMDAAVLCNLDLKKIIKAHLKSKKEITRVEKEGRPVGIYLMQKRRLMALLQGHRPQATENIYAYEGLVLWNSSVESYFQNSLLLRKKAVRDALFHGCHPVYTKVRDRVPTYYGERCSVENCNVADGCVLEGTVGNSILFRNVRVQPGAVAENCVIMNDAVIGEGAQLRYVILDKEVTIRPGTQLMGTQTHPVVIQKGAVV